MGTYTALTFSGQKRLDCRCQTAQRLLEPARKEARQPLWVSVGEGTRDNLALGRRWPVPSDQEDRDGSMFVPCSRGAIQRADVATEASHKITEGCKPRARLVV